MSRGRRSPPAPPRSTTCRDSGSTLPSRVWSRRPARGAPLSGSRRGRRPRRPHPRSSPGRFVVPLGQLPFPMPGWRDLLEILIVAYVIYALLRFLVGTRALQIVFGLLVLVVIYLLAFLLKLSMITYLLGVVFTYGVFAALVVFQPELRQALAQLGQSPVFRLFGAGPAAAVADEIARAVERLSRSATGAIIAVEREVRLDEY